MRPAILSSLLGRGAILQEDSLNPKHRHPSRYENGLWTPAERRYKGGKLECRGLLKALKKTAILPLWSAILVEIDSKMLVHQLNQPYQFQLSTDGLRGFGYLTLTFSIFLGQKSQNILAIKTRERRV